MKKIKEIAEEAGIGVGVIGDGSVDGVLGVNDNHIPSKVGTTQKRKSLDDEDEKVDKE